MGRFGSSGVRLAVVILSLWSIVGCGGGSKAGPPLFAGKINLSPTANASLALGGTLTFAASVQTVSGTTLAVPITFTSSDPSILNVSPGGLACAGHWDAAFTTCTPGATGPVTVTASALGASSVPTWVFVHPPIDSVAVVGVLLDGSPVQEPCLSQGQQMTLEAHAYSKGTDITASVGPFVWSANNSTVVALTPLNNSAFNFPTNQVTARAVNPGLTSIFATASGVTSNSFQQPLLTDNQGGSSPILDFFETCPIANISLELGAAGSGRTTFSAVKGTTSSETVIATVTDIMGNSSLPNTNGGIVLSKIPLTWVASQPQVIGVGTTCTQSCGLTVPSPGSGTVTASCSPPTCNVGFPFVPVSLSTQQKIDDCTNFFQAIHPQLISCRELIPAPVYASPIFIAPPDTEISLSPMAAISGSVTGTPGAASVLATSTDCAHMAPASCSTAVYYTSTTKSAGDGHLLPVPPNSFLFDPAGTKIFEGSDFGALSITPANFGTTNSAFASLGTVNGKVLAVSSNGNIAAFSDTVHTPNQVYVINSGNVTSPPTLNIPSATLAAFSPDALKLFIVGGSTTQSLYVYSALQALQGPIALAGSANTIAFSPNAAFAFIAETNINGGSANLATFPTCTNAALSPIQPLVSLPLPSNPLLMKVLPNLHIDGLDSVGSPIPDGIHILILDSTGFDVITAAITPPASGTLCPQGLEFVGTLQRIELNEGTLHPLNFFVSTDSTQLYIVNSDSSSILVYSFITGSVFGGIQLQNNAVPVTAEITADAGTIVIAGSDGLLHEVSTSNGGSDAVPVDFPSLPNAINPFCTFDPSSGPCVLNIALPKP